MTSNDKPMLGAAIATGLALYAIAAGKRERRRGIVVRAGDGRHGRFAEAPEQMTAAGWLDVLKRLFLNVGRNNLSLMAAGVAFYAFLSLAPGLTTLVALYGLIADPATVQADLAGIERLLPPEAQTLVESQLSSVVHARNSSLSIGFAISLAIALWSANYGTSALVSALNVTYGEEEKRSLLRYYGGTLLLTMAAIAFVILALLLIAVIPVVLSWLPLAGAGRILLQVLRWPLLMVIFAAALALLYRFGPSRNEARWHWVSWGATLATVLWLAGSYLFSLYVDRFATYNKVYGSLGAVVVLLMWLWLSAYSVLLGAQLNAEMEHQTARDTTDRPAKPMGRRRAYVADTLAPG